MQLYSNECKCKSALDKLFHDKLLLFVCYGYTCNSQQQYMYGLISGMQVKNGIGGSQMELQQLLHTCFEYYYFNIQVSLTDIFATSTTLVL